MKKLMSLFLVVLLVWGTMSTSVFAASNSGSVLTFSKKKDGNVVLAPGFCVDEFASHDGSDKVLIDRVPRCDRATQVQYDEHYDFDSNKLEDKTE
ncbi:MAG: hypothetical protein E7429_00895 [Ruminococcaceae bacterium]|nr:hypothetical protein [Oscillospiraceae bacterium]